MTGIPAFVRNGRLDIIGINAMGRALYSQAFDNLTRPVNFARFVFLDPRANLLHPNWSDSANTSVSILRTEAGRNCPQAGPFVAGRLAVVPIFRAT